MHISAHILHIFVHICTYLHKWVFMCIYIYIYRHHTSYVYMYTHMTVYVCIHVDSLMDVAETNATSVVLLGVARQGFDTAANR